MFLKHLESVTFLSIIQRFQFSTALSKHLPTTHNTKAEKEILTVSAAAVHKVSKCLLWVNTSARIHKQPHTHIVDKQSKRHRKGFPRPLRKVLQQNALHFSKTTVAKLLACQIATKTMLVYVQARPNGSIVCLRYAH